MTELVVGFFVFIFLFFPAHGKAEQMTKWKFKVLRACFSSDSF